MVHGICVPARRTTGTVGLIFSQKSFSRDFFEPRKTPKYTEILKGNGVPGKESLYETSRKDAKTQRIEKTQNLSPKNPCESVFIRGS